MKYIEHLIARYKHLRSVRQLSQSYKGKYAFVGIGNHSIRHKGLNLCSLT